MDVIVTRAAYGRKAWTLADLLGRPMGHIMEARGPGFTIFPAERAHHLMGEIPFGPFASLDDAHMGDFRVNAGRFHHFMEERLL